MNSFPYLFFLYIVEGIRLHNMFFSSRRQQTLHVLLLAWIEQYGRQGLLSFVGREMCVCISGWVSGSWINTRWTFISPIYISIWNGKCYILGGLNLVVRC